MIKQTEIVYWKELWLVIIKRGFLTRYQKLNKSLQWLHTSSPKKAKPLLFAKNILCTTFCNCQGILLVAFMNEPQINTEVYYETLKKLQRAIQNKTMDYWLPEWYLYMITCDCLCNDSVCQLILLRTIQSKIQSLHSRFGSQRFLFVFASEEILDSQKFESDNEIKRNVQ